MFVFGLTGVSVCGLCWVCVFGLWRELCFDLVGILVTG